MRIGRLELFGGLRDRESGRLERLCLDIVFVAEAYTSTR